MKLDPGMHIGLHLVFFGKSGVTGSLDFSIFGTICMLADANKTLPLADTQDASWEFRVQRLGGSVDLAANSPFEKSSF
jgi:hypothetical protein